MVLAMSRGLWKLEFFIAVSFLVIFRSVEADEPFYTLCLPDERLPYHEDWLAHFESEANRVQPPVLRLKWVKGRDKIDCLRRVRDGAADVTFASVPVLYIATMHLEGDYSVIGEIRDKGKQNEQFANKIVAVVRGLEGVSNINAVRHKGACMDAMDPVIAWNGPVSELYKRGRISADCSSTFSTMEMEVSVVKKFFGSVCTVNIHKQKTFTGYSNCPQCVASSCNPPDSWDDPLDCLQGGGGKIAFTTLSDVNNFLQENFNDTNGLQFLCPDDTLQSLLEPEPCVWGTEPWGVFLAAKNVNRTVMRDLQEHIQIACTSHLICMIHTPLEFGPDQITVPVREAVSPKDHLSNAPAFLDTYERPECRTSLRFCVERQRELDKCEDLAAAASALHVRPAISCHFASDNTTCVEKIADHKVDFAVLDAAVFYEYEKEYHLEALMSTPQLLVGSITSLSLAVVTKQSGIKSLKDVEDHKSCHSGFHTNAGWWYPLHNLIMQENEEEIKNLQKDCDFTKWAASFFSSSCVPGLHAPQNDPHKVNPESLCDACPEWRHNSEPLCMSYLRDPDVLDKAALRCFMEGGEVAFLSGDALFWQKNVPWRNKMPYQLNLRIRGIQQGYGESSIGLPFLDEYLLLCPNSKTMPLNELPVDCHWGRIPSPKVVTRKEKSEQLRRDIIHVLQEINSLMGANSTGAVFYIFGPYKDEANLLFKDFTSTLEVTESDEETATWQSFVEVQETFERCFRKPPNVDGSAVWLLPWKRLLLVAFSMVLIMV